MGANSSPADVVPADVQANLRQIAADRGLTLADLAREFEATAAADPVGTGHAVVARWLRSAGEDDSVTPAVDPFAPIVAPIDPVVEPVEVGEGAEPDPSDPVAVDPVVVGEPSSPAPAGEIDEPASGVVA